MARPNIIWLVAEDQSPEFFPMYGDKTVPLPNLEALATDAVRFTNAVSPVPVCAPARSSLITGMYPTSLGTHNMRTYKAWGKENEPSIGIPSYTPIVPEGVQMFPAFLRKEGYYCINGPKEDYNFAKTQSTWDESSNARHWDKREADQPFFAVFNFSVSHESQIWKRGKDSLFVSPESVEVPPYFPDNDIVRHDLAVNYSNLKRLDGQIGAVIDELKEDGLYDDSYIFFYADHGGPFPRHKRALYDTGLKVPLLIKFPKNAKAGTVDDRLISFLDFGPTVLSIAGIDPPKVMQGKAHFGPYKEEKGAEYTFHSADRFDGVYDRLRAVRSKKYKYIKSYDTSISHALPVLYREQMPLMQELRRLFAEGKLQPEASSWLAPTKPEEELYDLENDPFELDNLAGKPEMKDTLERFRKVLKDWIDHTNDLGRYPERELIDRWLPAGKKLQLAPLELIENEKGLRLISDKKDALILWKKPQDSLWQFHSKPLPKNSSFDAKAERIGYGDSPILEYRVE